MTAVITHSVSAGGTVDATASVDGAAWDANHVITGTIDVSQGGTGITSGTSGGIPYFSSTVALTSSALLTQYGPVYGGGSGGSPVAMAAGTDGQMIVGQTGAAPLWKTISGDITVSAAGAYSIGATKVTSAMLNSDVFSTAHSWGGQQTFTAPILGTPASGTLTNCTGLPVATGISGFGSNVASALQNTLNASSGLVSFNGVLGTVQAGSVLTNATGLPISTGVSGLGTGVATFLATPSSANLAAALTDETGTGANVFANTPTLVTPVLGAATGTSLQLSGLTASSAVATDGSKNLVSVTNTGTGNNVLATSPTLTTPVIGAATGTSLNLSGLTASSAVATDGSKNLVSVTNTGSGSNVLATSPTLVTPVLGAATATTINGVTIDNNAWSTYTPTITASSGTITSSSASGRYKQQGKTVQLAITVTITNAGTGAGQLIATLPVNALSGTSYVGMSKESFNTGKSGACQILSTDNTKVQAIDSTPTTFIATNGIVVYGITYEAA